MTTDLSNKSVEELVDISIEVMVGADCSDASFDRATGAVNELTRRLEEAQQKIVAQKSELVEAKTQNLELIEQQVRLLKWRDKNYEEQLAHDAKVAAEALEEARNECARILGDTSEAVEIVDRLWAEYRAKATEAGRKE